MSWNFGWNFPCYVFQGLGVRRKISPKFHVKERCEKRKISLCWGMALTKFWHVLFRKFNWNSSDYSRAALRAVSETFPRTSQSRGPVPNKPLATPTPCTDPVQNFPICDTHTVQGTHTPLGWTLRKTSGENFVFSNFFSIVSRYFLPFYLARQNNLARLNNLRNRSFYGGGRFY